MKRGGQNLIIDYIGFKKTVLARIEEEGCVIRRRPITQSKTVILKPIAAAKNPST